MNNEFKKLPLSSNRLEALGDGIFAVAATILILDIRLPEGGKFENTAAFYSFVRDVAPNVICYFVTFTILGIMWFAHRAMFEFIERTNRYFVYLGFLFYAVVCFIPFSTKMIAAQPEQWFSILVYGVNLSLCNITLYFQWQYGVKRKQLLGRELPAEVNKEATTLFLLSPVVYTVAIIIGLWFPVVSLVVFVATPVFYLLPNKLDKYMH